MPCPARTGGGLVLGLRHSRNDLSTERLFTCYSALSLFATTIILYSDQQVDQTLPEDKVGTGVMADGRWGLGATGAGRMGAVFRCVGWPGARMLSLGGKRMTGSGEEVPRDAAEGARQLAEPAPG